MRPEEIPVFPDPLRHHVKNQCKGKSRYDTSRRARLYAIVPGDPEMDNLCIYRCPHCGKWHIGHVR